MKKIYFPLLAALCLLLAFYFFYPQKEEGIAFYSTELGDDLKTLVLKNIRSAQHEIFVATYHLDDPDVIEALKAKANEGVKVILLIDGKAPLPKTFSPLIKVTKKKGKGIMHRKLLVIDSKRVLVGSANLTHGSLRLHHNIIAVLSSPKLAQFLKKPKREGFQQGKTSLFLLPEYSEGFKKIEKLIASAQSSVRVAMFTFTHQKLAEALAQAASRGRQVQVMIGHDSAHSPLGKKIITYLRSHGVEVKVNRSGNLLHYKLLLVDNKRAAIGSANWTQAAFSKNEELIAIFSPLRGKEQRTASKLWREIWQLGG